MAICRLISFGSNSDGFRAFIQTNGKCATGRLFQVVGNCHDIESYVQFEDALSISSVIFLSHWGHISVIFLWLSGNLFHIGWNGNYELWVRNPISCIPIAHGIWDPHFGLSITDAYSSGGSDYAVALSYSGIYNWLYAVGFSSVFQIYTFVVVCELLSILSLLVAKLHLIYLEDMLDWLSRFTMKPTRAQAPIMLVWVSRLFIVCFDSSGLRINFHLGILFGFTSIAWSGHLIHVAIPASTTGNDLDLSLRPFYSGHWELYSSSILTFFGGLEPNTGSIYRSDIAHHHLAIGVLFIWSGHLYSSLHKGFGHMIRDLFFVNGNSGWILCALRCSLNLNLSLALAGLSVITSVVAQHTYSLAPYPYLSYDAVQMVALYVHHSWIASFLMLGSFAHSGIFLIRDYQLSSQQDVIARILAHKSAIISHLSWVCLWLGFHTLGIYVHNDTVVAFGEPDKQILIEPVFAQCIQGSSGKALYGIGCLVAPNSNSFDSFFLPIGPGDFLVHHAISLGLHVTTLVLLKGSLDARGSQLMPDKVHFGYGFACDGPGRGGTCDISAWDSFYLASFWMLNTNAWVIFYFHWKYLTLNTMFQFDESSTYLNGWFRDYLWFNSGALIRGYDSLGANDLALWSWLFLAAHLCWATGFMFLISWRGYWQELIDALIYIHLKTPILCDLWNGGFYTPVALSIVQARFIGLVHFGVGFIVTYASFVIASTS